MSHQRKYRQSAKPGRPVFGERESLEFDHLKFRDLAATIRRQHYYKCRNRDGEYSLSDLAVTWFAAETADRLAAFYLSSMEKFDIRRKADEYIKSRRRLVQLRADHTEMLEISPNSPKNFEEFEGDVRDIALFIEDLEFKDILWRFSNSTDDADEAEARLALVGKKKRETRHILSLMRDDEVAVRRDIVSGENQDRQNLMACFSSSSPRS